LRNLNALHAAKETFLFENYKEYFSNLIPSPENNNFPLILCHNDPLENNILMK
jgi:thiamine kinase-like enzyme